MDSNNFPGITYIQLVINICYKIATPFTITSANQVMLVQVKEKEELQVAWFQEGITGSGT